MNEENVFILYEHVATTKQVVQAASKRQMQLNGTLWKLFLARRHFDLYFDVLRCIKILATQTFHTLITFYQNYLIFKSEIKSIPVCELELRLPLQWWLYTIRRAPRNKQRGINEKAYSFEFAHYISSSLLTRMYCTVIYKYTKRSRQTAYPHNMVVWILIFGRMT